MSRQKKVAAALLLICMALFVLVFALAAMLKGKTDQSRWNEQLQQKVYQAQGERDAALLRADELQGQLIESDELRRRAEDKADSLNYQVEQMNAEMESMRESGNAGTVYVGDDGVSVHGALHFEGTTLKGAKGEDVVLKGISTHGLLWFYEYNNGAAFRTLREYGANAIRLAMYVNDPSGGYVQNREMSTKLMYMGIENAKSQDLYAVVDWHVLNEQDPNRDVGAAREFFKEVTERYGDDPGIIYEICNEPNGDVSWDQIANYADQVIPVIRQNAPSAVIVVGTPNYSYNPNYALDRPLEDSNVAYSFHHYSGQHGDSYTDIIDSCLQNGLPVWISEWGINTDMGGDDARNKAGEFLNYINEKKLSRFAWALSNKDECFSIIRPDCRKLSDWTMDDFTEPGRVIINGLR